MHGRPVRVSALVAPRAGAWIETLHDTVGDTVALVAPRAGAWIETRSLASKRASAASRPVRARGLKLGHDRLENLDNPVAPRAGAWIETCIRLRQRTATLVAPRAGAWIETKAGADCAEIGAASRPVRARGLKPQHWQRWLWCCTSRPVRARGLKLIHEDLIYTETRRAPCGRVD